jgi:hypothetical protein
MKTLFEQVTSKAPERFVTPHAAKHQQAGGPLSERTPLQAALLFTC